MTNQNSKNILTVPVAVVVAGILIAGAIFFSLSGNQGKSNDVTTQTRQVSALDNMYKITEKDHILGNPNAPIKIVEYSDLECPFCQNFHGTMNQIMDEYGKSGKVAWIFRHFPLEQLHPKNARRAAVASECINELGGNDAFWKFTNGWFEVSPANDRTDFEAVTSNLIKEIGIDENKFNSCLASGKYDQHVQDDIDNAIQTGGRGTPWSILVTQDGQTFAINGAQPISVVRQLIETNLK